MASSINTALPKHAAAFDDVRAQFQIAKDEITTLQGLVGPGLYNVVSVPFTFATASPMIFQALGPGQQIDRAQAVITTAFDDPTANIQLGTPATPRLILDLMPVVLGQFANDAIFPFTIPDLLQFTIIPMASTQGEGFIFYSVRG